MIEYHETKMIDVSDAIAAAMKSLKQFYQGQDIAEVRLEEVKSSKPLRRWYITLGFNVFRPATAVEKITGPIGPQQERVYKVFEVDGDSGEVIEMTIRHVDT